VTGLSTLDVQPIDRISLFLRLTRTQFLPLILLPSLVGAGLAFHLAGRLNIGYLTLTFIGVSLLHLGANAIDDCYDFQNGVDKVADEMFPKDFGGWKPIARKKISLKNAKLISYFLLLGSLAFSGYFAVVVGPWAIVLGIAGVLLAIFYTAPPLKLDYRGYALGEISILFAFGPIPVLGSFYVQTGTLSIAALLASIPLGLTTVTILLDHDMIFYEVYSKARKLSLAITLGRKRTLDVSLALTLTSYLIVVILVVVRIFPIWSMAAPILSALVLSRTASTYRQPGNPPPFYLPFTVNGLFANWVLGLVLGVSLFI
jgi:1,4-dihydroxy-2-naphthoate polyprenyltransferase